ncbi:hypothetical protein WJX82_000685 [Trebouxia sp. C0006]
MQSRLGLSADGRLASPTKYPLVVDATSHVCVDKDPSANMHLVAQVPLR